MGAEPYDYTVPYEADIQSALNKLRQQVFESREFNGAEFNPATPEDALEMTDADGTRSILDISRISEEPDFFCAAPFSPDELMEFFRTDKPSTQIDKWGDFWDCIDRGMAR